MPTAAELNGHSGDNEIGTPDDLFAELDRRFQFQYDAFASLENALCSAFSTKDGTYRSDPGEYPHVFSLADGLAYPWANLSVFWNPPYGRGIFRQAIEKAIEERNSVRRSVGLVKYDASTENGRLLRENFHLEYLPRIKYKGMSTAATFTSVIAINRPDRWRAKGAK